MASTNGEWIGVSERLPQTEGNLLIVHINSAGTHVSEAYFKGDRFLYVVETPDISYSEPFGIVTHWMPLPLPPAKK